MNITFLLILVLLTVVAIFGIRHALDTGSDFTAVLSALCAAAAFILLLLSFVAPLGTTVIEDTTQFRVEKTEYRVILNAFGQEQVFKDAYTVLNAGKATKARRINKHNVWGISLDNQRTLELIFD